MRRILLSMPETAVVFARSEDFVRPNKRHAVHPVGKDAERANQSRAPV
jgi:hypothetical protein